MFQLLGKDKLDEISARPEHAGRNSRDTLHRRLCLKSNGIKPRKS